MIARANARQILAVEREMHAILVAVVEARLPLGTAAKLLAAAALGGPAEAVPAERPADRYRRENAEALAIMAKQEGRGRGRRSAARTAARDPATDPHDPAEVERLSQRFRRHRRTRK
jgi:hypothetical protein